jgi:putative ABC transport system permease protein
MSLELGPILRSLSRQKGASLLVVLELATGFATISCLLLASGWYQRLANRPSGYREDDLVMVALEQPAAAADAATAVAAATRVQDQLAARMAALPEVAALVPVSAGVLDQRWNHPVEIVARDSGGRPLSRAVGWTVYTGPGIQQVLGLRLLEGAFPAAGAAEGVTVLTRCLRQQLFPGGRPALGGMVEADDALPARVVGVVEDVVLRDPWNAHGACVSLRFGGVTQPWDVREARYLVRARPGQQRAALARLQAALGPSTSARRVVIAPFDPRRAHPTRMARGLVVTLGASGGVVVLCALLGTLTVSSFLVAERARSIGIRRALGARPQDIVRYFLIETSVLTALGVALGLLFTGAIFLVMKRLYPGLQLRWSLLALTAALLWAGAILGVLLPARRAAEIAPSLARRG